ncbi:hypothetical protein GCM10011579_026960 [Streptomyces albiflavescens]|uniref:Uncharacterized protein n=1 Tax=Streptomyces albiflavescens TaxID=1623582 RepID=A0A918D2J7_9ACTN|nr:hypothetical protein GCM10011579_026960 [Streptomyces albiflavescens]
MEVAAVAPAGGLGWTGPWVKVAALMYPWWNAGPRMASASGPNLGGPSYICGPPAVRLTTDPDP